MGARKSAAQRGQTGFHSAKNAGDAITSGAFCTLVKVDIELGAEALHDGDDGHAMPAAIRPIRRDGAVAETRDRAGRSVSILPYC